MGKHFGGGEKYLLDCVSILKKQHRVFIGVSEFKSQKKKKERKSIKEKYEKFFDINLDKVKFINSPLFTQKSFFEKLYWTKQFDLIIYETDGSLFFSLAKKNILHIQTPLILNKSTFLEKLKLKNWQIKNSNSEFTKQVIEKYWKTKVDLLHYPMVDIKKTKNWEIGKKKIILNVGRFFSHQHSKRQDILVKIFKDLNKKYSAEMKGWRLILIGTVEDRAYARKVEKLAEGSNVKIIHQASRREIINWYQKASIYWHATGFDVDQEKFPEKVEHFGISTVEAMSSACVPIVINKGGQPEVLGSELEHLLWSDSKTCVEKTIDQIQNPKTRIQNAKLALKRAEKFSKNEFEKKLMNMIKKKV